MGGGGCPGQFILTPSHLILKYNYFAYSTYFKLYECEDVSIINISQVKLSYILCRIVPYAYLQGWGEGGGESCPGQFILPSIHLTRKVKSFC